MPPTPTKSPKTAVETADPGSLTPATGWILGGLYVLLVIIGFCFGVWAGNEKPKVVEVAAANPAPSNPAPQPATAQPPAPQPTPPEPKPQPKLVVTTTPEPKPPSPKMVEPKTVEQKPPEPKPEPKTIVPKPPEPTPKIRQVSFQKEVLPVFRAKCLNCHGAVGKPKGGLDLQNLAAIAKGGDSGDALVAGNPDKSSIWTLISDGSMPPPGKAPLTPQEIELIKNWILSGGK